MAEEERAEEQIATPPEGTPEVAEPSAPPAGPTLEELQTQVADYEKQVRELDGHRRGQAATITRLTRQVNDFTSLREDLKAEIVATREAIKALAKVTLTDETTEDLPPSKLQQFEAQVKPVSSPTPQLTPEQTAAAETVNTLLLEADIDPKAIPDDLKEAMEEAGDFWKANITGRAVKVVERALLARKTAKETETMSKKEADDQKEREKKAASLKTDRTSSVASSLNPKSYESLSKIPAHKMSREQLDAYKEAFAAQVAAGKPL